MKTTKYQITIYQEPLTAPRPPRTQRSAITKHYADSKDAAIRTFITEIIHLDTGCVQLWDTHSKEIGRLYL